MKALNLTVRQILILCDVAGISYDDSNLTDGEYQVNLDTEYTIATNMNIDLDDGEGGVYSGLGVFSADYPEDGATQLN